MSFGHAIRVLNGLKRRKVLKDYVLIGAFASTAYMEPVFTEDLDIIVLVDTDSEYRQVFRDVAKSAERVDGMHLILGGVPVQIFPTTTKPVFRDAMLNARSDRIDGLRVKIASPEHLIVLYLEAFRYKDQLRILRLLEVADIGYLRTLLERFDDEQGKLEGRLKELP
jgi:predicted nucleotidyltransferase